MVPSSFGKEGKGQEVDEKEAVAASKLRETIRKYKKRMMYLADDTIKE